MKIKEIIKHSMILTKEEATKLQWVINWYNDNFDILEDCDIDRDQNLYYIIKEVLCRAEIEGD